MNPIPFLARRAAQTLALTSVFAMNAAFAADGRSLLMTEQAWAELKSHPEHHPQSLATRCEKAAQAKASPFEHINPPPHYTATGTQQSAETDAMFSDGRNAYQAAICWRLTGKLEYAQAAQRLIDAWAQTNTRVSGAQGRSLVNFGTPHFLIAASWVRGAAGWNDKSFLDWVNTRLKQLSESGREGNHANWGNLLDMAVAAYQGDDAGVDLAVKRWRELVLAQVAEDGHLPKEVERSGTSNFRGGPDKGIRGLAYTHYALLPFSVAAEIATAYGRPAFDEPSAQALTRALDKAAGWAANPGSFPYYTGPAENMTGTKQIAYFSILLRHLDGAEACKVLRSTNVMGDQFQLMALFSGALTTGVGARAPACPMAPPTKKSK